MAVLNPGRSGLLALGTDALLDWRLQAMAQLLHDENIDICITPGARFLPGAALPAGYPYCWLGERSASWGAVGIFLRPELLPVVRPLPDVSSARVQWFEIWTSSSGTTAASGPSLVFAAVYPAPGGDVETWSAILGELTRLRSRFPHASFLVAGDANIHLSYVLSHRPGRGCCHCHQSPEDRDIEAMLCAASLIACNPPAPTHDSGTCIDLVLADLGQQISVAVLEAVAVASDHRLLCWSMPCQCDRSAHVGFGRVSWRADSQWDDALSAVEPLLQFAASAVELCVHAPWLRPPWSGGQASVAQRRVLLDMAAWSRDVLYTLAGHAAGVTRAVASAASRKRRRPVGPAPADFSHHQAFKKAATQAAWDARRGAAQRFPHLRALNPGAAERFLSSFFAGPDRFEIALADPATGRGFSADEMLQAIEQDLQARASNNFPHDREACLVTARAVSAVRQSGAARAGAGLSTRRRRLYSMAELAGGVGDPLLLLLALLLHAQLRGAQGPPTYWALTDLRWAFDVASHDAMRLSSYLAGVVEDEWLLLDDFIQMDIQFVALQGLASEFFRLPCGTAQGKRFSAYVFNAEVEWLADAVMAVLPQGCATWVPPVYRRACPVGVGPPPPFPLRPPSPPSVNAAAAIATSVSATALGEGAPWARAAADLAEWACGGATEADRAAAQDALGAEHLQPLQFSDDLIVPCPPPGALRAVVSAEPDSACSRFARAVRADFNYASGKTAAMAVAGSPDPGWVGCPVVDQKLVLGEVVVAQCGWTCRLGTRMLERAIMARARLLAQPPDHPGTRMLALARRLTRASWASAVAARMAELTPPVLDIDVHPAFRHPLRGAQGSLQLRRSLLRDFKLQVVRPALRARDRAAFQRATGACLPTLGMSFAVLVPEPNQLPMAAQRADLESRALLPPLSHAAVYMYQLFREGPPPEERCRSGRGRTGREARAPLPAVARTNSAVHAPLLLAAAGLLDPSEGAQWSEHRLTQAWWQPTVETLRLAESVLTGPFVEMLAHTDARPGEVPAVLAADGGERPGCVSFAPVAQAAAHSITGYMQPLAPQGPELPGDQRANGPAAVAGRGSPSSGSEGGNTGAEDGDANDGDSKSSTEETDHEAEPAQAPAPSNGPAEESWAALGGIDLQQELRRFVPTLQNVPRSLRAETRMAFTAALKRIKRGHDQGNQATTHQGWTLFLLASRLLLSKPKGADAEGRQELLERAQRFRQGDWLALLHEANTTTSARSAEVSHRGPSGVRVEHLKPLLEHEEPMGLLGFAAAALAEARVTLEQGGFLVAFLDDVYINATRARARAALDTATGAIHLHANVDCHLDKCRAYSRGGGAAPPGIGELGQDVWSGDRAPPDRGIKILGRRATGARTGSNAWATRTSPAAYWGAWADALHMLHQRRPVEAAAIRDSLDGTRPGRRGNLAAAAAAAQLFETEGFRRSFWTDLLQGLRPEAPPRSEAAEPGEWQHGWQFHAYSARSTHYRGNVFMPSLTMANQAMRRSGSGPRAAYWLHTVPTAEGREFKPARFLAALRRRLRLPGPLDPLGDHLAACPRTGLFARRAKPLGRAWARVAREAGGRVVPQQLLRDTNAVVHNPLGRRQLDLVVYGILPNGAPLCCDSTMVPPLRRDGRHRPRTFDTDGAALLVAERRKRRRYHELTTSQSGRLMVLSCELVGLLAKQKARAAPALPRRSAELACTNRWWGFLSVAAQDALMATLTGDGYLAWGRAAGGGDPDLAEVLLADSAGPPASRLPARP
ncbi:unnamed protein product [Prorocentrum cordatum]|uniref:Uncharacterized protein n=1 Tax=Prorocentrum cordatum TaxID=2364126 RepID=A0ABN9X078_9DINO|nr:unnamed protein product [Polarella glacialis]